MSEEIIPGYPRSCTPHSCTLHFDDGSQAVLDVRGSPEFLAFLPDVIEGKRVMLVEMSPYTPAEGER